MALSIRQWTVGVAAVTGQKKNIFAEILHSDETRPTLTTWIVRLVVIASALISSPSAMLNAATAASQRASLSSSHKGSDFVRTSGSAAVVAGTATLVAYRLSPSILLRPAPPFYFEGATADRLNATDCLAAAAWYEAGDDPEGQQSVMQVVLNRVRHPAFPSSVCGVVFEGSQLATGCQFTFTCDGSLLRRHPSEREIAMARRRAAEALDGSVDESVGQATHYHANYVNPWWSSKMRLLSTVGLHIFYGWPGPYGSLPSRRQSGSEPAFQSLVDRARSAERLIASNAEGAGVKLGPAGTQPLAMIAPKPAIPESLSSNARPSSTVFMAVDPSTTSGGWAVTALGKCNWRRDCQVLAYQSAESIEHNRAVPAQLRDRPLFLFVRDGMSGIDVALWDCERVSRPKTSQCLPDNSKALAGLMRERSD